MENTMKSQPNILPKDGQVVLAIMKEMGITEYDPETIVQLTEFMYRYATSIIQEARLYANNTTKKCLEANDIKLAIQLTSESTFTTPPPREIVLECASVKNYSALPTVKPSCGLTLPPNRYCLSSCNFTLKSAQMQPPPKSSFTSGHVLKMSTKSNISFVRKQIPTVARQNVTIPKPTLKIVSRSAPTVLKPKIHITKNIQLAPSSSSRQMDKSLKRKREDMLI